MPREVKLVGFVICWTLSTIAFLLWLARLPQLSNYVEALPDSFGMEFLYILIGIVVVIGSGLMLAGIWWLIWRPNY